MRQHVAVDQDTAATGRHIDGHDAIRAGDELGVEQAVAQAQRGDGGLGHQLDVHHADRQVVKRRVVDA